MSNGSPKAAFWVDRSLLLLIAICAVSAVMALGFFLSTAHANERRGAGSATSITPAPQSSATQDSATPPNRPKPGKPKRLQAERPLTLETRSAPTASAQSTPVEGPGPSRPVAAPTLTSPPEPAGVPASETAPAVLRVAAERVPPPTSRFPTSSSAAGAETRGRGETYVAGFVGPTWPSSSDIELFDDPAFLNPGTTQSDTAHKNSMAYGAKVGRYFDSTPWLGVEMEVYNTNAHEKQQTVTRQDPITPPTPGTIRGLTMRVLTVAFNVMARYPGERLQPYAGVGIGAFFARRQDALTGDSASSTRPGLNAEAGLRYKITQRVGAFAEWKYNRADFSFDPTPNLFGQKMTYENHMALFGLFLSFN